MSLSAFAGTPSTPQRNSFAKVVARVHYTITNGGGLNKSNTIANLVEARE